MHHPFDGILECFRIQDDVICLILRTLIRRRKHINHFVQIQKPPAIAAIDTPKNMCTTVQWAARLFISNILCRSALLHCTYTQPASVCTITTNATHESVNSLSPSTRTATPKRGKAPLVCVFACIRNDKMQRCIRTPTYACATNDTR